jgi:hypothetical protein
MPSDKGSNNFLPFFNIHYSKLAHKIFSTAI